MRASNVIAVGNTAAAVAARKNEVFSERTEAVAAESLPARSGAIEYLNLLLYRILILLRLFTYSALTSAGQTLRRDH
jgi:hypothetical protein